MLRFMISIRNTLLLAAIAITAATITAFADQQAEQRNFLSSLSNAYILPGISAAYIVRDGYLKYDGIDQYQRIDSDDFVMAAFALGKRFALKDPRFRLQAALELGRGLVKEDEYDAQLVGGGHIPVVEYSNYILSGALADAHWLFPAYSRTYYLSAGAGLHVTGFYATLETAADKHRFYTSDIYWTFSPSINLGAGTEYRIGPRWALALSYNFRFMMSMSFSEANVMFPMGAEYKEFFYMHALQAQILLPELWKKKVHVLLAD